MGGSLGRTEATGYGVIYTVREALKELGIDIKKTTAAFQGFGNVAQYAIRLYQQYGGKAICVSCWDQKDQQVLHLPQEGRHRPGGAAGHHRQVRRHRQGQGQGPGLRSGRRRRLDRAGRRHPGAGRPGEPDQRRDRRQDRPHVKIIAEGANGPTTPEADEVIKNAASSSSPTSWPTPAASPAAISSRCSAT